MSTANDLSRRLTRAISEAEDADRVWRMAMAHSENVAEESHGRRCLDALWQERERANTRVVELQWLVHARAQSSGGVRARWRSAKATMGVLGWHAGHRLGGTSPR